MFKRILVPVDPARRFDAANQYAVDMAHAFGSKVVACYVIDEQLLGGPSADEAANSLDQALEWVGQQAMDQFCKGHPELETSKSLAYGNTPTALFQVVLQTGADVVVLGGYHDSVKPHVWGSIVVDVVQHAERPVFIVRRDARLPSADDTIVVPFDASERAVSNISKVAEFALATGAKIDLVHVAKAKEAEESEAILRRGAWVLEQHGIHADIHTLQSSVWRSKGRTILDYAKAVDSPLIALSRLGRHSQHTGRSRTVAWLVARSDVPVWVVRK